MIETTKPILDLDINGQVRSVTVDPSTRLSEVLREELGLTGTKVGCNAGDCGACTVLLDNEAICACLTPAIQATGRKITSIEGTLEHRLQTSFAKYGAAQCGICTPGMVTAGIALLSHSPKPDRGEVEDAIGGVLCRCTGYHKIVQAILNVNDPESKTAAPAVGSAVGSAIERLDGIEKINGTDKFGADVWPADALLVRAIRSPHFYARFSFGNIEEWKNATDGIEFVFTAEDIPGRNCFGVIPDFADQPALAVNVVRHKGEPVALVAGTAAVLNNLSLEDFPVHWNQLEPTLSIADAQAVDSPIIHDDRPNNLLTTGYVACGDAEQSLKTAPTIVSGAISTSFVEHAYIEPEAGVAYMEGDQLVIRACTQAPTMDREDTAAILGLPIERVRIIPSAIGGGFGSKLDVSVQPLIGLVTLKTGRPARMVYSRQDSMSSTTKRHPCDIRGSLAVDDFGKVLSYRFDGDFNTGSYASWGPTVANRVPVHASGPYKTPNYRAETRALHSNGPPAGAFRGFGVPQATLLLEYLYDEMAQKLGRDRLEFRRDNALQDGDRSVCGQVMRAVGIGECLDALKPRWAQAGAEVSEFNAQSKTRKRGIGVASCWYGCGNTALPNPSTIRLGITQDGQLYLHQGATDIGQGSNTVITQICADALGVSIAEFNLIGPDTALTPDCGKTSASRQTFITGKAAQQAGHALRETILRETNMGPEARIDLTNQQIVVRDGATAQLLELSSRMVNEFGYVLMAEETYDPPTEPLDAAGQGSPYAVYGYGAQMAEVEVDMELGTVKVLKITAAHDLGRVVNPLLAKGQIEGGIAQGLGLALMEEFIPGKTENLHDYLIPTVGDMPAVDAIFIENPDPEGPMGVKGLGEHVLIPTAPAILNAIYHASSARVTQLPATPHRVYAAIKRSENQTK